MAQASPTLPVRPAGDHRRRYVVFWLGVSGLGWITFPICTSQGLSSLIGVGKAPGDKQADAAYQQDASYQDLHRLVAGSEIRNAWTFLPRGGPVGVASGFAMGFGPAVSSEAISSIAYCYTLNLLSPLFASPP